MDLNVGYGGHVSGRFVLNYAVELMAEKTAAYEVLFSNDLNQLKYDRLKQFDAVFLNSTVGMLFADPEVREGLTRFVREGGGLGGNHGTSHASMDWPEFGEMLGTYLGTHRQNDEQAMLKIDDPGSPLTQGFHGQGILWKDEFYRFPEGPYSRDKLHVLLSIDVAKTDMNQGRPCSKPCSRPDHDYAISWIRSYGKGRVFYTVLGHQPSIFSTPAVAAHFLTGIQFILGDLEADTTPSARLTTAR
jgi:type 1 glutamine amidotransferase